MAAGELKTIRVALTAGAAGVADDTTVAAVDRPRGSYFILDIWATISTAVTGGTLTLRTAASGGGDALSDDMQTDDLGTVRNFSSAPNAVRNANSTLVIRRSDGAAVGVFYILCQLTN